MKTCTICGDVDNSFAAEARYHKCGYEHLLVQNAKYRTMIEDILKIANNDKVPHTESINHIILLASITKE